MAVDTEFRDRLAKAAVHYGIPEGKASTFAAVVGKSQAAADWKKSGLPFDTWFEGILEAQKDLVALLKRPLPPGFEGFGSKPGTGDMSGKSYKEIMQLAEANPAAFKTWYKEHRSEFQAVKAKEFAGR